MSNEYRAAAEYWSDHEREKITAGHHGPLCLCDDCYSTDWQAIYEQQQEDNMDEMRLEDKR